MKTLQKGFTLIELVVVIVILGILAATALPKFVDLSGNARAAVIKGVMGSMTAANSMLYAKANAANATGTTGTLTVGTASVALAYGFASNATELAKVMDLTPTADFTVASSGISHAGATTATACVASYTAATSSSVPPSYAVTTSGC